VAAILRLAEKVQLDYEVQQSGYRKFWRQKLIMVLQSDEKYRYYTDTMILCV
jgi:hypothetical protein